MTLEEAVKEVSEHYKSDPSRASITLAYLDDGTYYCSICRYKERLGNGKEVVAKYRDSDLATAVASAMENWKLKVNGVNIEN